jgi:hypothetical protein
LIQELKSRRQSWELCVACYMDSAFQGSNCSGLMSIKGW